MQRAPAAPVVFSLVGLAFVLAAPSGWAWDSSCRVKAPRDAAVDATGTDSLRVVARAGSLRIVGERGLTRVVVSGQACSSDKETLEAVRLRVDKSGREVRVTAELPETDWSVFGRPSASLDLEVRAPAGLAVQVDDSSGETEVTGVASLRIEDDSGSLRVNDVVGEVRVRDGSGEIAIERAGAVVIDEDGSGAIEIAGVKGDVEVADDGSGEIAVRDVSGSVRIGDTGSGGVRVDDVGGDLVVRHLGSGGIHHTRVKGRVDVPEDGNAVRARDRAERERERERRRAERERERAERDRERARRRTEPPR
jgi:hypothetical protein